MAGSSPAMTRLRRSVIGWRFLPRRLLALGRDQRAAHLVSRFQRALDMFVVRLAFEEDQDIAVRALSCVSVLDTPRPIPEAAIASGATNLNCIVHPAACDGEG